MMWWYSPDGKEPPVAAPFPDWITQDSVITVGRECIRLRNFLHEECKSFQGDEYLNNEYAIYYLVVQDTAGETTNHQIYIGYASRGVMDRWSGHCTNAKKVLEEALQCRREDIFYDHCKEYQLVDVFVALARLRKFKKALFVLQCCEDYDEMQKVEGKFISLHAATDKGHGLNLRQGSTSKQ